MKRPGVITWLALLNLSCGLVKRCSTTITRTLVWVQSSVQKMLPIRNFLVARRLFSTSRHRKADPWPLPHTKQHMEATAIPPNVPKPIPVPRRDESLETLRARLTYQTRKRGTLESDLIMSTFAKEHLRSLTRDELLELDQVTCLELDASWSLD